LKKHLLHIAVFMLIFFSFSCKKEKKDKTSPLVAITNPLSGAAFQMFDTLDVSAHVSDETQISSIVVALTDINNTVLQYSYSVPVQSNDFTFNIKYYLTEYHLPSGFYYMSVTVSDGSNFTQRTVKIHITESPTVKTGYFWVGSLLPKQIIKANTGMVQQNSITLSTGFNGMAFGPYYQQLFINGNLYQPFIGYDAVMNGTSWSIPYSSGGIPNFMCVATDGQKAFIGYYSGDLGAMTYTGGTSTSYPNGNSNYYPFYFTLTSNYGIGIYKDKQGGSDKLMSFGRTTGTPQNNTFMPIKVSHVFERTTTELFILGNNGSNQAVFYLYTVNTNALVGPFSLPAGKLLSAAWVDSDYLLLAMDNGIIYGYRYSNSNATVLANVKAQKITYDTGLRELNAAVNNGMYSYSLSTNYVLTATGFATVSDSIIGFEVITNK